MYSIILFSGLVKNLCIGARISLGSSHIALLRVIFSIIPFIPIIQWESLYNSIAYEMIGIDAIESIASPSSSSSSSIKKKIKNIDITNYNDIKDIKIDRNTSYIKDSILPDNQNIKCRRKLIKNISINDVTKVYINGTLLCWIIYPLDLVNAIRILRRNLSIDSDTSVAYNRVNINDINSDVNTNIEASIKICNDPGRVMRALALPRSILFPPSFIPPKFLFHITTLQAQHYIEYIDASEEKSLGGLIAHDPETFLSGYHIHRYTHCEIAPSHIFSASVGIIPNATQNQSARNTYEANMGKQAIQVQNRTKGDTASLVMDMGQMAYVHTEISRYLGIHKILSGHNVRVALLCCTGFNVEDAIMMNTSLVDSGAFNVNLYRLYKSEQMKHGSTSKCELFEKPDKLTTSCLQDANYDLLDKDGLICPGRFVDENGVIIGKTTPANSITETAKANVPISMKSNYKGLKKKDVSKTIRQGEAGTVAQSVLTVGKNIDLKVVNVVVRISRRPNIGDKFSLSWTKRYYWCLL